MNDQSRAWWLRLIAGILLAVCGGVTAMLATHRSAHPVAGGHSIPAIAALAIAGTCSVGLATVVLLPSARLARFQSWLSDGVHSFRVDVERGSTLASILLASMALSSYLVIAGRFVHLNAAPLYDQHDYLMVAANIQRTGGLVELGRQLWTGKYLEANRHPLYTAILSLRPDFVWGKRLSCAMGLCALVLLWWRTTRQSGGLVAGVSAILIATNSVFLQSASLVACEMMLTLWTLLAWFTIEQAVLTEDARPAAHRNRIVCCVMTGIWLGLAYLTKASAVFLLIGFWAWSLLVPRLRRWSWLAVAAFVVISAPLLVRNIRAYGNPLYSFNTRFLFADTFEQGVGSDDRGVWTGAREYWQTHSAASVGRRALSGLMWEAFILLRSLGPATLSESRSLVGLVMLLLAALGAIGTDRRIVLAAIAWLVPFYVFFAWYVPIAAGDRFLAPLVPVILIFAARGAVILLQASVPPAAARTERRILCAAALWCATVTMLSLKDVPSFVAQAQSGVCIPDQVVCDPLDDPLGRDIFRSVELNGDASSTIQYLYLRISRFHRGGAIHHDRITLFGRKFGASTLQKITGLDRKSQGPAMSLAPAEFGQDIGIWHELQMNWIVRPV